MSKRVVLPAAVGIALGAMVPLSAALADGQVLSSSGRAFVDRDNSSLSLSPGMAVHTGDRIYTKRASSVTLQMQDDALLTLGGESALEVVEYQAPTFRGAQGDSPGRAIYRHDGGQVIVVTGLISQRDPESQRIETEHAALIAHGTEFSSILCDAHCASANEMRAGQYVGVLAGNVSVGNSGGSVSAAAGGCVYVAPGGTPESVDPSACARVTLAEFREPHFRDPEPERDDGLPLPPPEPPVSP